MCVWGGGERQSVWMCDCMYLHTCVCMHACVRSCMRVRVCVCVCVCVCLPQCEVCKRYISFTWGLKNPVIQKQVGLPSKSQLLNWALRSNRSVNQKPSVVDSQEIWETNASEKYITFPVDTFKSQQAVALCMHAFRYMQENGRTHKTSPGSGWTFKYEQRSKNNRNIQRIPCWMTSCSGHEAILGNCVFLHVCEWTLHTFRHTLTNF